MSVDGTMNRYIDEPPHLLGLREDEPLHIPGVEEYYANSGRVLISSDFHQYFDDTPFNLMDGPAPAVLGSFAWSSFPGDGALNVDLTSYFYNAQIANELPYTLWRVRGIYRGDYTQLFLTSGDRTVSNTLAGLGSIGDAWNQLDPTHWALALNEAAGNLINPWPGSPETAFFMGGPPGAPVDQYFLVNFQIEVGYGTRQNAIDTGIRTTGSWDWPAFGAGIRTNYNTYRAWSSSWACFNGYANAPNVIAAGGCPFTGQGGYVPPDEPEDE